MIEALQAGLTASALFLFAIMIVALVAFAAAPVMKEAWTKWRKRGKLDKVVSLVAVGIAIAYGGSKSHDVPNAGADDGIALVGISAEHDPTNDVTAVNVKYTAGDVTVSTPVSVRNAESEQWRALEKIDATVTTGQTNVLAFAVAGNAATNRYWWVGVNTPAVIIESQGITITNYVATSKSVRIDWTCDDPKATVFAVQRKRKKPTGILYDAEVEYLESTGTQYIDTGVYGNDLTAAICSWSYRDAQSGTIPFGSRTSAQSKAFAMTGWSTLATMDLYFNFSTKSDYLRYVGNDVYAHKWECRAGQGDSWLKKDGVTVYSNSASVTSFTTQKPILLFGMWSDNSLSKTDGVRIWAFSLYNNNTLVRDYIAIRKSGVGYLYDRVSKSLFGNAGTGAFAYGSDTLSYDWETVDTTSANTYTFDGFTIGEDWEWRIMATYTEGDE